MLSLLLLMMDAGIVARPAGVTGLLVVALILFYDNDIADVCVYDGKLLRNACSIVDTKAIFST